MDARFQDLPFSDRPLKLRAGTAEDLQVISALLQDAVGKAGEIAWLRRRRRLALVLNRFRWEDRAEAERARRAYERVRTAVLFEGVLGVRARGVDPADKGAVYELLALGFEPGEDGAGTLRLTLAGGAELAVEVECLDVQLADMTRPWRARRAPEHDL